MDQGRKVTSFSRTGARLAGGALGLLMAAGSAGLAFAEGGQTEVAKTTPSNPPPVAIAPTPTPPPAAVAPAPAPTPQPAAAAAKPANPLGGGAASSWRANVAQPQTPPARPTAPTPAPTAAVAPAVAETDMQIVTRINAYFNGMTNISGLFVQTDPDNRQKSGRFYLERPGKVRFDYGVPSRLKIISDGQVLAIEDHELNTSERYPVDMTPFRLLLAEKVDLTADANILGVEQGPNDVVVTVEDKKSAGSGRIRLFFNKADMSLKEWIVSDAQGLDTRIEVSSLEQNKQLAPELFELSRDIGFGSGN
jgi:outer membrane lipoprotein-sorting protein